jgi:geranylgeranyl pyrophosphate synthase
VIRALRRNDAVAGELRSMLGSPLERGDVDRARKLVRADGAIEDALVLARSYADEAIDALAPLADVGGAPVEALAAAAAALPASVPEL